MELKELQKKSDEIIDKMDEKFKCKHCVNNTFMHLIEEVGEVADELNKPNIRGKEIDKKELGKELADVIMFSSRLASLNDIDLEEAIDGKINELIERFKL
jgi:NTP pyrophosphatase (non-canonical NTP hydrolase)